MKNPKNLTKVQWNKKKYETGRQMGIATLRNMIQLYELMLSEGRIQENGSSVKRMNELKYKLASKTMFIRKSQKHRTLANWIDNKYEKNS
tara:strand:- start:230 stop:499 length:270 start_codon:yes stop_codon:yes gene_type:complete